MSTIELATLSISICVAFYAFNLARMERVTRAKAEAIDAELLAAISDVNAIGSAARPVTAEDFDQ